jgi:hypothetical protein
MFDDFKYNTMKILEFAAYIALGFIPTLGLEIGYRVAMKIRRRKGVLIGRGVLPPTKSLLPIPFRK